MLISSLQKRKTKKEALQDYLGISSAPTFDLEVERDKRSDGATCTWIDSQLYFTRWRDETDHPQVLWLIADKGFGKSRLASYIIDQLIERGEDCSYFFFRRNRSEKATTVGKLLRSIAYQMTLSQGNEVIRESICALQEGDSRIEDDDEQAIWQRVFLDCIFKSATTSFTYWIIDSIDSSNRPASFSSLLDKAQGIPRLRVLVTSRKSPDLLRSSISKLKGRLVIVPMPASSSEGLSDSEISHPSMMLSQEFNAGSIELEAKVKKTKATSGETTRPQGMKSRKYSNEITPDRSVQPKEPSPIENIERVLPKRSKAFEDPNGPRTVQSTYSCI